MSQKAKGAAANGANRGTAFAVGRGDHPPGSNGKHARCYATKDSKKARIERCRKLIDRQTVGQLFADADLAELMEYTGQTYLAAKVVRNPTYPGRRYVRAQNSHGVWDGISWLQDINKTPALQLLKTVFRAEVKSDTDRFFLSAIKICADCGTAKNPTVDHKDKPFDDIFVEFYRQHGPIKTASGGTGAADIIADRELARKWFQFHASQASYQILCGSCNSSKGKS